MQEESSPASRLMAEIADAERAERTRLADRLHDEGLQLVLAAKQDLAEVRDGDERALEALASGLEQASDALRSLTSAMHEDVLARLPLEEALERIGSDAARRGRFTLSVTVEAPATGIHDAFVRDIVRELLANAARHARATHVRLEVLAPEDAVIVRVVDDGRGFDVRARLEAERAGHVGLGRLERNASELGGRVVIDAPEGGGTTATVWLPRQALVAQRSLEDALHEERRWTAALIAALQDGLMVFRDGVLLQVNDAFCDMVGFSRETMVGTTPDDYPFWAEEDRDELRRGVTDAHLRSGLDQEVVLVRASGEKFLALACSARIDDPAGDEIGMLVTVKDLTERRAAEERKRLQGELRTTIETTRHLTSLLAAVDFGVPALLEAFGQLLIEHLGWGNAVINLRVPGEDRWDVSWTSSPEIAAILEGVTQSDADWAVYLAPRFERRGAFFVEAGSVVHETITAHVPAWTPSQDPAAWLADDLLLIPLCEADGACTGLVSVDCPASGLRPTDTELDALVAAGQHAAGALALARSHATAR